MRLSIKRKGAIYDAIYDAVMDLRVALARDGLSVQHDAKIAQLEVKIWDGIKKALDLHEE